MELENAKGTRDFGPDDKILRNEIVDTLRRIFETYGFSPIETPVLEKFEVLTAKGGAGSDSDAFSEIYKLTDQGERKLGLRFDLTVPFARFVGMNPNLRMPFKRYQIEPVFRDGPIKLGRYRQFYQCDADVVGSKDMITDAEIMLMALSIFKELGLDAYLEVNNRKILKGLIKKAEIEDRYADEVIISLDKIKKIGKSGVKKELEDKGIPVQNLDVVLETLEHEGTNREKIEKLKKLLDEGIGKEGLDEIEQALSFIPARKHEKIVFTPSLARGLGYYTGTIFEGFMRASKITSSICGGGRYDNLVGKLLGSEKDYPAVGISFGLDVITDVMKLAGKETRGTVAQAYIIPIKTLKDSFEICSRMRKEGIKADMDVLERGISKNLNFVNTAKIPFAIFVGARELEQGKIKLKDMSTGEEYLLTTEEAIEKLRKKI